MAESHFIRTVTYGGYDKADVVRRLDSLYERIFGLERELRETKLLLEASGKGEDIRECADSLLAEERDMLAKAQAENETLTVELEAAKADNKKYESEIRKLKASVEEAGKQLNEANTKLAASGSGDDAAALSTVFIEAKKSADMLESAAREKAGQLESSAAEAAEKSIAHANDESAVIINDAECRAAEIIADAKNAAEEMAAAYVNMRASILSKMLALGQQLGDFKDALMKFEENGVGNLYECEELLEQTQKTLNEGGVPEFREAVKYEPEYPERPVRKADLESEESKKRKSGLDRLRQMAESLAASKGKDVAPAAETEDAQDKDDDTKKGGKIDLAALAKKAKSLTDEQ